MAPRDAGWITLLAGVAVSLGIEDATTLRPGIKWPNDLLLNEKKIGGILTELRAEGDKIDDLVLGIGINVNTVRFPAEISGIASSLKKESKKPVERETLLVRLLSRIENGLDRFYHNGPGEIAGEWTRRSAILGQKVAVEQPGGLLTGTAVSLDPTGGLVLEKEDRSRTTVLAGDVIHLKNLV